MVPHAKVITCKRCRTPPTACSDKNKHRAIFPGKHVIIAQLNPSSQYSPVTEYRGGARILWIPPTHPCRRPRGQCQQYFTTEEVNINDPPPRTINNRARTLGWTERVGSSADRPMHPDGWPGGEVHRTLPQLQRHLGQRFTQWRLG